MLGHNLCVHQAKGLSAVSPMAIPCLAAQPPSILLIYGGTHIRCEAGLTKDLSYCCGWVGGSPEDKLKS